MDTEKAFESYFGGKGASGTFQLIINHIRPHERFVEVFAGNATITSKMRRAKENLLIELNPEVGKKLDEVMKGCDVRVADGLAFLKNELLNPNPLRTNIFLDPPYPEETRKSDTKYDFELSDFQHEEMLKMAVQFKGVDLQICTYPNDMYRDYLSGWKLIPYESMTRGGLQQNGSS